MDCTHQAPLSMGFSRQEYWSGLPCPPPGDLPHPESLPERSLAGYSPWGHRESRRLKHPHPSPVVLLLGGSELEYLELRLLNPQGASTQGLPEKRNTLTEILAWLENLPLEVVILTYRNFQGMMEDLHEYLMGCIKNISGDMLCPHGLSRGQRLPMLLAEVLTLCQLWSHGQQVILSYKDETSMSQHEELRPNFIHYLEHMKSCSHPGRLLMAGINLTENLEFVLVHPACSLEKLIHCTNTIAGDFIWANGFVGDDIGLNRKLLRG
ncbi:hypothetical protein FD755_023714 [Muntiacus reevesi]|uniref:Uncharacterized protein n=1 Tax=Muntiacus reevesi TaxID=9886 RepID=A0A5N3VWZ3_MUNRE|nr:hypothetical protein FD755_023715 [Muntiacus reevesi]KAB0353586.1 hypothetical protein FD755_023714 [Muntiacus reevesi]